MKLIYALLTLFAVSVSFGAPANKTLNIPIYENTATSFVGRAFTVSGNNNKVLGITGGDWALVSPLFGTSPTITTSILTDSTTFGLFNTTATTINAFGAATTLNVGANAATVLNFGGAGTAAQFRFIEPGGSNYTGFKAQAQAANITYTLPAADGSSGQFLKTNGSGTLSWGTASGGGGGVSGSEGGNGAADSGLAALFDAGGGLTSSDGFSIIKSTGGYGASFDPDSLTAARAFSFPDVSGVFTTDNSTSTLTNKTLTSPAYTEVAVAALDIDWSAGSTFTKTLAANSTFTFSNLANGKTITVALTNTASNYTVTWPTVTWPGGVAPTQTIGAKTDIYSFWRINGVVYGSYVQNF